MEGKRKKEPCQGPGKVPGSSLAKLSRAGLCLPWAQASHWPGFVSKSRELGLSLGSLNWVCEGSFEASVGCSAPNPSFSAGPSCKYLNAGVAGPGSLGICWQGGEQSVCELHVSLSRACTRVCTSPNAFQRDFNPESSDSLSGINHPAPHDPCKVRQRYQPPPRSSVLCLSKEAWAEGERLLSVCEISCNQSFPDS